MLSSRALTEVTLESARVTVSRETERQKDDDASYSITNRGICASSAESERGQE